MAVEHENMVRIRARSRSRRAGIPNMLPLAIWKAICSSSPGARLWRITAALKAQRAKRPQNSPPAPALPQSPSVESGRYLQALQEILVPELNMGQLLWVLRAKFLVDGRSQQIRDGRFKQAEQEQKIEESVEFRGSTMSTARYHRLSLKKIFRPTGSAWCLRLRRLRDSLGVQAVFPELGIK